MMSYIMSVCTKYRHYYVHIFENLMAHAADPLGYLSLFFCSGLFGSVNLLIEKSFVRSDPLNVEWNTKFCSSTFVAECTVCEHLHVSV